MNHQRCPRPGPVPEIETELIHPDTRGLTRVYLDPPCVLVCSCAVCAHPKGCGR